MMSMEHLYPNDAELKSRILKLHEYLLEFSEEYYDLHPPIVTTLEGAPSPLSFLRNWLSRNVPVIFKNAICHWPALTKWNDSYLRSKLEGQQITVAVTPNGYADAVFDDKFVLPEERSMTFDDFLSKLQKPTSSVFYVQKQNNNLFEEFSELASDVDTHIAWATEALGRHPDAVNFWMGDGRAVTSLHKDHYENIYCVVKGRKEFILHSPTDVPWIPYESFKAGMYHFENEMYNIKDLNQEVKWIPVDPLKPDLGKYPLYENAKALHCVLDAGDVLYLPALWFHHVRQSHSCIAVNYWYDMDFDMKYCYFKCLEKIGELCK